MANGTDTTTTTDDSVGNTSDDNPMDLLMRHSSPLIIRTGVTSPLAERNSSPSSLLLSRPRSNPRNRTPMRYESPLNADAFRIDEAPNEGRRVTTRMMAGRAVGTTMATTPRIHEESSSQQRTTNNMRLFKSQKQGPSHRKMRRWNNDNFVNLAAEINSGKGGRAAAEVLMLGHANASQYRSVLDPNEHKPSEAMTQFLADDTPFKGVRDQFFEGGMAPPPKLSRDHKLTPRGPLTAAQMLNRIDGRLRRVVVKACENSFPASKVVETFEQFMVRAYKGKQTKIPVEAWEGILLEPPTVTHRNNDNDDTFVTRFLFDGDCPNAGFHRLLLHGLCQFHGLRATSSTMEVLLPGNEKQKRTPNTSRLLTAAGTLSGPDVRLVDHIMERKQHSDEAGTSTELLLASAKQVEMETNTRRLAALKV